jgi:hypothetical protein
MYLRCGSTITWRWLLQVETCRYMHNLTIINRCNWLKLYILSNFDILPMKNIKEGSVSMSEIRIVYIQNKSMYYMGRMPCSFRWMRMVCAFTTKDTVVHKTCREIFNVTQFCKHTKRKESLRYRTVVHPYVEHNTPFSVPKLEVLN